MDVFTDFRKNILTCRANQWHIFIITPFVKRPCPARQRALRRNCVAKIPIIEIAPARRSE
jgi:hypothetical protein